MIGRVALLGVAAILCAVSALAQEREWNFNAGEDEAFLVFGVPESEDIGVSFWCTRKSGSVKVFVADANEKLAPDKDTKIEFAVTGKHFAINAKTVPNELDGTTSAEGMIPTSDPLLAALQSADRFVIAVEGEEQIFPRANADFDGLLSACAKS